MLPPGFAWEILPKQRVEGTIVAPLCPTPTSTGKSSQHLQRNGTKEQRNLLPEHFHLRHHVQSYLWIKPCPWGQGRALRQKRKQEWRFLKTCVTPKAFGKALNMSNWAFFLSLSDLKTIIKQVYFPFWWIIKTTKNCATDSGNCWFCFKLASFRTDQHLCFPILRKACLKGLSLRSLSEKAAR